MLLLRWFHGAHGTDKAGILPDTFIWGFPRVFYSFFMGVILYRLPRLKVPAPLLAVALVLCFMPRFQHGNALYDIACITIFFPLIMIAGIAGDPPPGQRRFLEAAAFISFPIYILHLPVFRLMEILFRDVGANLPPAFETPIATTLSLIVATILGLCFDRPVRRLLARHLRVSEPKSSMLQETGVR